MSETYQLVSGADPEMSLYEGIALYETGEVYGALSCWRELLQRVPDYEIAQHYIKFVQGYLGLSADASEREVSAAQLKEARRLRGEPEADSPHQDTSYYRDESATQHERVEESPETLSAPPTRSQVTSRSLSKTAIGGIEPQARLVEGAVDAVDAVDAVTPSAVVNRSAAEVIASRSSAARHAVEGPSGPRTQADGLTIQSLSRQLASLHRSGKYEEAVEVAKQLLIQDPQHQVARRYIDEYHRQKQVAIQQRKKPQDATSESAGGSTTRTPSAAQTSTAEPRPTPTSAPTSIPAPISTSSDQERGSIGIETYLGGPSPVQSVSAVEFEMGSPEPASELSSEAPTRAPAQAPVPQAAQEISDLEARPRVKMRPDQISWQEFDHRAGFFTSQVDGETSYEELIMISGMPREQALKILNELVTSGVIG